MDLLEARQKAKDLISKHCPDFSFRFDRAKQRFGSCNWNIKEITLSQYLTELNSKEDVIDTILHEIAHALTSKEHRRKHHGREWKHIATSIGCCADRCYDDTIKRPKGNYIYQCPACSEEYDFYRKLRRNVGCTKCCEHFNDGKYSKEFKLELVGERK
jgi:predicted SprT family Zn-dependent metalloprotease